MEKIVNKKSSEGVMPAQKATKKAQSTEKFDSKIQIAVIKTGGKQYLVKAGDQVKVEKLPAEPSQLEFIDLLHNKKVTAEIQGEIKTKKITGVKFKKRKGYLKRFGHRQNQTIIKIIGIK